MANWSGLSWVGRAGDPGEIWTVYLLFGEGVLSRAEPVGQEGRAWLAHLVACSNIASSITDLLLYGLEVTSENYGCF